MSLPRSRACTCRATPRTPSRVRCCLPCLSLCITSDDVCSPQWAGLFLACRSFTKLDIQYKLDIQSGCCAAPCSRHHMQVLLILT